MSCKHPPLFFYNLGSTNENRPVSAKLHTSCLFQTCNRARCSCTGTQRHVDPKRPHRQDLCGRCKGKRLSCESTFSFKYII